MKSGLRFDYAAVGHVTVDVLADGTRRAGGTALYSALQASRLGLRTVIVTQGVAGEIEELLAPYADELELRVLPALATTTLETTGSGSSRSQRVLAWAGELPERVEPESAIVHLGPVARETPARLDWDAAFLGLTPQGLVRSWPGRGGEIGLSPPAGEQEAVAGRCDAIVLNETERASCAELIARGLEGGATVAITAAAGGARLLFGSGQELAITRPRVENPPDDLGAGDVFAAALFVALYEGQPPARAGGVAAAAAAARLSGVGAAAIGGRSAIEARLAAA